MMKYVVLLAGLWFSGLGAAGQSVDWSKARDWKLFAVHGRDIWALVVDSVDAFPHVGMQRDSCRYLLEGVTVLGDKKAPVWMGGFVVSCRVDSGRRKLLVSSYGGFFYDALSKQYFRIAADRQREWLDYVAALAAAADSR